jgi:serine/threonine protein kinase/tetratricopeptide (TPR) repeat protein
VTDRALELGEFILEAPIGRGGMARVWRGIHRSERAPVAIKLVTADPARHRTFRDALLNEVRAMTRLDHPGIVAILDHGVVSEQAAAVSDGELVGGSPYLVMELADGGTLRREHVSSWAELRTALGSLLAALSHAHARGVIHRDLKPSNVLVDGPFHALRLSDFGIAHAIERAEREIHGAPLSAGTAWFMAPEQILGLHREEGPWTDLYALGCIAYLMLCRRLPYPGRDREVVYRAHCLAELPPLRPAFEAPSDIEAWISVLMAKRPHDRFELASDALCALEKLGGAPLAPVEISDHEDPQAARTSSVVLSPSAPSSPDDPTRTDFSRTRIELPAEDARSQPGSGAVRLALREEEMRERSVPDVAAEPLEAVRARTTRLLGIGLGVFGLRPIPLAGRESQRARLWGALAHVARSRAPCAITIRGRAGYGKTRLAEWLAELAAERGAARVLWVRHDATPSPRDAIARMIERFLRSEGLAGEELDLHLAEVLPALDPLPRAQLATLLAPGGAGVMRREDRFAIVRELLVSIARRRPVLLVFDDAQHGPDAIAFVDYLLRLGGHEAPAALAVLTLREEALEERPSEAADIARLLERPRASEVYVGPLSTSAHARLVEDLLGLEPELASRVAVRTAGSPLFAVQLVGDWVERGCLAPHPEGFALVDGADAEIPDDIHALWSARVDRIVHSIARGDVEGALAIMGLLGRQVVRAEWEHACREAGIEAPDDLLEAMANQRLALVGRQRFTLVHGMLHESLERRLRESGRAAELNQACATMLEARYPNDRAHAERLAGHLIAAGRPEDALPALLSGARVRLEACDFDEARSVCARYASVLDRLGADEEDPRRVPGWIILGDVAGTQGMLEESMQILSRAEPIARRADAPLLANVLRLRGGVHLKRGAVAQAHDLFIEALALTPDDPHGRALCVHGLGESTKLTPKIGDSIAYYEEAGALFTQVSDRLGYGRTRMGLADVLRRRGDLDRATQILEDAVEGMRTLGNRHSVGVGLNGLGDIARSRGRLEEAERRYADCLSVFAQIASEETIIPRLNLALVLLARGSHHRARAIFEAARPELGHEGREGYLAYVIAGSMAAAAGERDFEALARLVAEAEDVIGRLGLVDDDIAECLRMAADLGSERIELSRRARVLEIAQWGGLGRDDDATRAREKLDAGP